MKTEKLKEILGRAIGVLCVFYIVGSLIADSRDYIMITECEQKLPRDQSCVIVTTAILEKLVKEKK